MHSRALCTGQTITQRHTGSRDCHSQGYIQIEKSIATSHFCLPLFHSNILGVDCAAPGVILFVRCRAIYHHSAYPCLTSPLPSTRACVQLIRKGIPTGEHLLDMFKLEHFERVGGGGGEAYFGVGTSSGPQFEEQPGEDEGGFRSAEAECLVTRRMCNYMPGTMHGGAIAVAAEEIARRCRPAPLPMDTVPVPGNPRVQYMEVHYMSPIKRRAGLAAVSAASGTGKNITRVGLSEVGGTEGGVLSAEAVLLWSQAGGGGVH
ncbi:unnamed protein product [Ectocarpus fasciculatus]